MLLAYVSCCSLHCKDACRALKARSDPVCAFIHPLLRGTVWEQLSLCICFCLQAASICPEQCGSQVSCGSTGDGGQRLLSRCINIPLDGILSQCSPLQL